MRFNPGDKVQFTSAASRDYSEYFGDLSRIFTIKGDHDDLDRLWLNTYDENDYWSVDKNDIELAGQKEVLKYTPELRGKVLLIPTDSGTEIFKILDTTIIRYTEDYILINEKQRVPFDQELLDGIIVVLNNDGSNPLQQILNKG